MNNVVKTFIASASELQSSDLYMTVKATLFTIPEPNLNGVRCTHEFLSEIVENQEKYIGLPLCADVKNLAQGQYEKLGHCYNPVTGTFLTSMIGSFYKFEAIATENDGEALVGYARILKRNKAVCKAIGELFAEGALKFSFEITCGSYEKLDDETILIDKSDDNYLEGMCVVSFPACPEAVALQLVAEIEACNKDHEKEAEQMPNEETVVAEVETEVTAEETQQEPSEVVAEETEKVEEENKETAEVVVHETHTEINEVCAYDTETGDEVCERNVHEITTRAIGEEEETQVAEQKEEPAKEEEKEEVQEAECKDKDKETASIAEIIAELRKELTEMRNDIQSVRTLFAEHEEKIAQAPNPFMAEINQPKKYSLLDSEETESKQRYSLLDAE